MAGIVKHARLESRSARNKLKRGRKPHWQTLVPGRVHLGYQRWKGEPIGRWLLRRYLSSHKSAKGNNVAKYAVVTIGQADDEGKGLSYEGAVTAARAMIDSPQAGGKIPRLTVRQAYTRYVDYKRQLGQPVADLLSRGNAHILPTLGDVVGSELTAEKLRTWLQHLGSSAAQSRPKGKQPKYRPEPKTDEQVRQRRASANRVLTMLKAALNHAYDEGHVPSRDAWGRKLRPFPGVEVARIRYLNVGECQRLLNTCDADFRPLVRAALETGCRYGELTRCEVQDFNPDTGTLAIRKSKTGKARHIVLTPEGTEFLRQHLAGRAGSALMFLRNDGEAWGKSEQGQRMRDACARAKITPPVSFHILRHTWASLSVMAGVPLMVVAKNLGHASTAMTEKHYGHLSAGYVKEAIHAGAPRFDVKPDKTVVPLR
jgi:integrase